MSGQDSSSEKMPGASTCNPTAPINTVIDNTNVSTLHNTNITNSENNKNVLSVRLPEAIVAGDQPKVGMIQVKKRRTVGSYKFKHLANCYQFGPWINKQRDARCVFCSKRMAGSKPGRLASHINNCDKAPSQAKEIIAKEIILSKRILSPSFVPPETTSPPTSASSEKDRKRKQPANKSNSKFNSGDDIDKALATMMLAANLPPNFVELPSVREFVRLLDPTYKLPTKEMIKFDIRRRQ